jgi:hypothetical protein
VTERFDNYPEVQRSLGRIEGKLDSISVALNGHFVDDNVRFGDLEKELRKLQQNKWFNSGFAAAIGSAFSVAVLWLRGH